jgi:hypothetical protein
MPTIPSADFFIAPAMVKPFIDESAVSCARGATKRAGCPLIRGYRCRGIYQGIFDVKFV